MKYDTTITTIAGQRALVIMPVIDETMSEKLREGLARRRVATLTGKCRCGGSFNLNRAARRAMRRKGRIVRAAFLHEIECLASDETLVPLLRRWAA